MLYWSLMFLIVAMMAAVLGFGGIAVGSAGIAKALFVLFTMLFVVSLFGEGWTHDSISWKCVAAGCSQAC